MVTLIDNYSESKKVIVYTFSQPCNGFIINQVNL